MGAAFKSPYLCFQPCNLAAFQLFLSSSVGAAEGGSELLDVAVLGGFHHSSLLLGSSVALVHGEARAACEQLSRERQRRIYLFLWLGFMN